MTRTDPCRTLRHSRGLPLVALLLAALACGLAAQAWRPARAHAEIARCDVTDPCSDDGGDGGGGYGGGGSGTGGGDWGGAGSGDYGGPATGGSGGPDPAADDPGATDPGPSGSNGSGAQDMGDPSPANDPDPSTGLGPNSGTDPAPADGQTGQPAPTTDPDAPWTDPDRISDPPEDGPWDVFSPDWLKQHAPTPFPPPPLLSPGGGPCDDEIVAVAVARLRTIQEDLARKDLEDCAKANGIPILTARAEPPRAHGKAVTATHGVAAPATRSAQAQLHATAPAAARGAAAKPAAKPARRARRRRPPHRRRA